MEFIVANTPLMDWQFDARALQRLSVLRITQACLVLFKTRSTRQYLGSPRVECFDVQKILW